MPVDAGPTAREVARMYAHTFRRSMRHYGLHPFGVIAPVDRRMVFVVGCPRSGTTFTAGALGAVPGFVDLGEVPRFKNAVPGLFADAVDGNRRAAIRRIRSIITSSQRIAMAASKRSVEQTPEATFIISELAEAFPDARFVHLIRDGRDVATSLLDRGWLAADPARASARDGRPIDDAGHAFGNYARFWVEPGSENEFESLTDAARCGWAWRRYVSCALSALEGLDADRSISVRYEDLASDPASVGRRLASALDARDRSDDFVRALSSVHSRSVGGWATKLTAEQVADVLAQESALLESLGYLA